MQKVRLSDKDLEAIKRLFREIFGKDDHLWLFGSRVDLNRRGGDIDLYIETKEVDASVAVTKRSRLWGRLQDAIGAQKLDILLNVLAFESQLRMYNEAKTTGVMLV